MPNRTIFNHLSALADTTRSRLLLLLEGHELAVGELCSVLQLPQSTVSRHLKILGNEGWVVSRAEGTSRRYRMPGEQLNPEVAGLWRLVREQVAATPAALQDEQRLRSVLAERRTRSKEFFSSAAGNWDQLREELFGVRAELPAMLALFDADWVVGDLGCGTGRISEAIAPYVGRVIAVDDSAAMLAAATARLSELANVEVRHGDLEDLPIDDGSLDVALSFLALNYLPEPARAITEMARVLGPGGRVLLVDMTPHDREEYRQQMGQVWLGLSQDQLGTWVRECGLEEFRYLVLPPAHSAKGPALFAVSARKPG